MRRRRLFARGYNARRSGAVAYQFADVAESAIAEFRCEESSFTKATNGDGKQYVFLLHSIVCVHCWVTLIVLIGSFGRRASDGGANLQIYYPTSCTGGANASAAVTGNSTAASSLSAASGSAAAAATAAEQQEHNVAVACIAGGTSSEIQR